MHLGACPGIMRKVRRPLRQVAEDRVRLREHTAILEFETSIDGKYVNGVDIIRCNEMGRIVEFRVMIRPLQAVNAVHQQMAATLERMSAKE